MMRPSNSGTATWVADVERGQPVVVVRPAARATRSGTGPAGSGCPARQGAPTSQLSSSPPALTVAGLGAPGGQHGDDQGVEGAELGRAVRRGGAQRGAVDRHGGRHRRRRSRRPARATNCGVSGRVLGAVEQRHRRVAAARTAGAGRSSTPHSGSSAGGSKPSPVSSTVSDRKACSCAGCRRRPGPGSVRLCGDADRHRRVAHQLGVGGLLAAEDDDGHTRARALRRGRPAKTGGPRIRTMTRSAPSSSSASSVSTSSRDGLAHR